MNSNAALAYLLAEGNLSVPCSRYGTNTEQCAAVALRVAVIWAEHSGDPMTPDTLDAAMSLVVNDSDGVAELLADFSDERATADTLSDVMEFDRVIHVDSRGRVTTLSNVYAPSVIDGELDAPDLWELLGGYSGQDRYSGPIMHPSESIGGKLAADILSTPGVYVAVVAYSSEDGEPEGWAIARPTALGVDVL